jgi:hypothetical protein
MWMEFTPKDWSMVRVGLIFRDGDPDPEDPWVRGYLQEHQLEPRYRAKEERHGIPCDVLYFGQCYLGRHLHSLERLYQRGLERSLLTEKLRELRRLGDEARISWPVGVDENALETVLASLAEALHEQVSFGTDGEGFLTVTLDPCLVARELARLTAVTSPSAPPHMSD